MVTLRMEPVVTPMFVDTSICIDDNVMLSASSDITAIFEWLYNGSVIANSNTVTVESAGDYTVRANTAYCASIEHEVTVNVLNPVVEITTPTLRVKENSVFEISVINPNSNFTYSWENQTTGDVNTGVSWTTALSEDAIVTIVAHELHCEAYDQLEIIVLPYLEIPNVFTPNDDGEGDTWQIDGLEVYNISSLKIYNRWGNLVFESIGGYQFPWDGTYKGKSVPNGTYFYIIELYEGGQDPYQGSLNVLR